LMYSVPRLWIILKRGPNDYALHLAEEANDAKPQAEHADYNALMEIADKRTQWT
jgi:hypothetical protein